MAGTNYKELYDKYLKLLKEINSLEAEMPEVNSKSKENYLSYLGVSENQLKNLLTFLKDRMY